MSEVGIRELKQRATQIMREVREKGETYTITYQGRPCGLIVPYSEGKARKVVGKGKGKGRPAGLAALKGILRGTPEVPFEAFMDLKKVWTKHLDEMVEELAKPAAGGEHQDV